MRLADAGSSGPGPVAQGPGFLRGRRPADPIMLCRSSAGPCLSAGRKLPAPHPAHGQERSESERDGRQAMAGDSLRRAEALLTDRRGGRAGRRLEGL